MNIHRLLLIICVIFSQLVFSQDQTGKSLNDTIKFFNGTIKEGKIKLRGIYDARKNANIKLCDKNYENCTKYKIKDISDIIVNSNIDDLTNTGQLFMDATVKDTMDLTHLRTEFKILYSPKKRHIPLGGKLIFEGETHDYYSFISSSTSSNTFSTYRSQHIFVCEKGSNLVKYGFQHGSNKKTLKKLKKLFKNCSVIIAESKKKKKEIKNKPLLYFLKIIDKCLQE